MRQLSAQYIAEDLKFCMTVGGKAVPLTNDAVLIYDSQRAEGCPFRVVLTGKGKGQECEEPAVLSLHASIPRSLKGLKRTCCNRSGHGVREARLEGAQG